MKLTTRSRPSPSAALLVFLAASGLVSGASGQCFNLDGSQVTDPGVVPCQRSSTNGNNNGNNNNGASMCCNLGRTSQTSRIKGRQAPGSDDASITQNAAGQQLFFTGPDICLSNGLCQLQLADAQTGRTASPVQFSRDSCTRPDWGGGCLRNVCTSVTGDNAAMTPCGSGNQTTQWCCGSAGSSTTNACCAQWPNHPNAVQVPAVFGASSSFNAGGQVDPGRVNPSAPFVTQSVSIGPGGVVSLVTITVTPSQVPTASFQSSFPASATFVRSRPAVSSISVVPTSVQTTSSTDSPTSATALGASTTNSGDTSHNGEAALVTGATGLNTQEVAGIVAGLVVVVVVLVSIACFTAENMYKKRQQRYRAKRIEEAMKQQAFSLPKSRPLVY